MAKIKINDTKYDTVLEQVTKAKDLVSDAETIWGTNFDNLYQNFITSGFLEDLYKDAESIYYQEANAGHCIASTASGAGLGVFIGSFFGPLGTIIGGAIGAGLGLFTGIVGWVHNPSDVNWSYESKKIFEELLKECVNGDNPSYTRIINLQTKLKNVEASLTEIKTKINEYNHLYANLKESADELGLKTTTANDGLTILSVDTDITVDGSTITTSVSDAMNAFYTYNDSVINAEIEANYLKRKYGINFNYKDIVAKANSFMSSTIRSGLYSHEFVDQLLPNYKANYDQAVNAVTKDSGLTSSQLQEALKNTPAEYAALIGASFIANSIKSKNNNKNQEDPGGGNGDGPSGGPNGGETGGGNNNTTTSTDNTTDDKKQTKISKVKTEEETKKESIKDILESENPELIDEIESELPESVSDESEKDYDLLAREQYESQDPNQLNETRQLIVENANSLYESGNIEPIKEKLASYGYNESDIEEIIQDRNLIVQAMLDGNQRKQLAYIAKDLANKDGATDFDTSYDDEIGYERLINGESEELLTSLNSNEEYKKLSEDYNTQKDEYMKAIDDVNYSLKELKTNKEQLDQTKESIMTSLNDKNNWNESIRQEYESDLKELKQEYIDEYGKKAKWTNNQLNQFLKNKQKLKENYVEKVKNDSNNWSAEKVDSYNKAVESYNKIVQSTTEKYEALDSKKSSLNELLDSLNTKKDDILNKTINNSDTYEFDSTNNLSQDIPENNTASNDDFMSDIEITSNSASIK